LLSINAATSGRADSVSVRFHFGGAMRRFLGFLLILTAALGLIGCASSEKSNRQRQVASVVSFLYPGSQEVPPTPNTVAVIKVPFRIGVAFVPDTAEPTFRLPESERLRLAGQVREAFAGYPFISQIEAVPSLYLEPGGGFANLDRVASLLRLDVIALISYDQVQHADASEWSMLYWTLVGAYLVKGDRYDVMTAVETAVFDVRSRRLLMRAAGTSNVKGSATMVGFTEASRSARTRGFEEAVNAMITSLHGEVKAFRERAPRDPNIRLDLPPGYDPNAARPAATPPQSR
jgi:rhombotail lipoprotein